MPDLDKITGYRLPGAASRLSAKLKQDRASARVLGSNVAEPSGPSMKELDKYTTDTVGGKLARRQEATKSAAEGRQPVYGSYKKGGMVKHTGLAKVHRGERVLNRKQTKKYSMRKG